MKRYYLRVLLSASTAVWLLPWTTPPQPTSYAWTPSSAPILFSYLAIPEDCTRGAAAAAAFNDGLFQLVPLPQHILLVQLQQCNGRGGIAPPGVWSNLR
eukprot:scaffold1475_cov167-Amphora_coffeaeformis.AAC.12